LQAIHEAGLSVFLIWESNPTSAGYFSNAKGVSDAKQAVEEAQYLGAPAGTAIYFTVDFDAQAADMAAIVSYFEGVKSAIGDQYLVGAYGSAAVLETLKGKVDKYYQTYAWSDGVVFPGNIYQYQNSVTIGGVAADKDTINTAPGAWPEIAEPKTVTEGILIFGPDDFITAERLATTLDNEVAIFIRLSNGTAPKAIDTVDHLYVVGGSPSGVDHSNQTVFAGANWFATVAAVGKQLGY
jgi:hypothetical protein